MLDIKLIRQDPEKIKEACRKKQIKVDVDRLLEVDRLRRERIAVIEEIQAQKNRANREIVILKDENEKKNLIAEMKELDGDNDTLANDLRVIEEEFTKLMLQVPNLTMDDVPDGKDETENKVIRRWGKPEKFDFAPLDHVAIGENLDIIDVEMASKIVGSRFGYLKGDAALLEFALIKHTFDVLASVEVITKIADSIENGYSHKAFIPVVPPVMIRPDVLKRMARLSDADKDERYYFPADDLYLVGSAEHTLGPLHMDQILDEKDLPIRYVGFSTAFRREAGASGKDTRGILRVHQFDKIEMESFTTPENAVKEQNFIVGIQEYLVQSLKIPYQVVMICTGDMGKPDARQIDIECWMPSQNKYRETHTSDMMTDYQARRLNTRLRRKDGSIEFVHMNDATAFAIGRILIAIMENNQQKDGSIKIPEVLQGYMGKSVIAKK